MAILSAFGGMTLFAGGVAQHVRHLLLELREADVTILCLTRPDSRISASDLPPNVTVRSLRRIPLPMTLAGPLLEPLRLVREVRRIRPDVIHVHMLGAPYGVAGLILARTYPVVLTAHTTARQKRTLRRSLPALIHDGIWAVLERLEARRFPALIAVSRNVAEDLNRLGASNVKVIPSGVGHEWFRVEDQEVAGRILFVGRLSPVKGIEYLIEAADLLQKRGLTFGLRILGPPEDREYCQALARLVEAKGLSPRVYMPMQRIPEKSLMQEYAQCSVFVLPSLDESQGLVLLEAMAAGKPIVATRVGGIPELVEDGSHALLVESRSPEAIADAVETVLKNPELRRALGSRARERAATYTWERCAREVREVYEEVLRVAR